MNSRRSTQSEFNWALAAETITVRIRWFGLLVGVVLANIPGRAMNPPAMNAILALGAGYVVWDTLASWKRRVFLGEAPIFVSFMEAMFIGLLCYFDSGLNSPFRFYYCLSLLICALRYTPALTWATCCLHAASYILLIFATRPDLSGSLTNVLFMLVLMGWLTWAGTSLAGLIKSAGARLVQLNQQLQENQLHLEERIADRTRELQQSQALLVQQEKQAAFGLLAAGIAHEVGNPLAAISSLVQLLRPRHTDAYTSERLALVDEQLQRIQQTLGELVHFSRPASPIKSWCDVNEVTQSALDIAKYYQRRKGREIHTEFAPNPPRVWSVRDQLVQVILNLVLNALDATPEGGQLTIQTGQTQDQLQILVEDSGSGIAREDREKIFQPYFTTKKSGTGLGLFVSRHLLSELGDGDIELVKSSRAGSTFRVRLKILRSSQRGESQPTPQTQVEQQHAESPNRVQTPDQYESPGGLPRQESQMTATLASHLQSRPIMPEEG